MAVSQELFHKTIRGSLGQKNFATRGRHTYPRSFLHLADVRPPSVHNHRRFPAFRQAPISRSSIVSIRPTCTFELPDLLQSARKSQTRWARTPLPTRISSLRHALQSIAVDENERKQLSRLISEDMGKVPSEAREEVRGALEDKEEMFRLMEIANREKTVGSCTITREPHGAVAVLPPWNFPVDELLLLSLPALAAGNVVAIKPSENAPRCGGHVTERLSAALPEGVVTLVRGGALTGEALVSRPEVDMVAMTGSSATGRKILEACAPGLKRAVLELGGKDPMIVFADSDLKKAVRDCVRYSLWNSGQVCCAIERVYVEHAVVEDFKQEVVKLVEKKYGGKKGTRQEIARLVNLAQKEKVADQVELAIRHGAEVLWRESEDATREREESYYPITVLSDCTQSMGIMQEETFGPVICISSFNGSEEEAVRLANDSHYALTAYVYSKDLDKANRVARSLKAGQVGINCYSIVNANAECPWVGHKFSGYGCHSGLEGYRQFSSPKSLVQQ